MKRLAHILPLLALAAFVATGCCREETIFVPFDNDTNAPAASSPAPGEGSGEAEPSPSVGAPDPATQPAP